MSASKPLPSELYSVASVIALERIAIDLFHVCDYTLMKRAGAAVFDVMRDRYAQCRHILVVCGAGNNAGDGYVVARLAKQAGLDVTVVSLIDTTRLGGPAKQACQDWCEVGVITAADHDVLTDADIVVDAMLGTGLKRDLDDQWAGWIAAINHASKPVVAVDVPSGLYADTGCTSNAGAVMAEVTISFIGLKQGLFTAQAGDFCGEILLDTLGLGDEILSQVEADALLLQQQTLTRLAARRASSNKGSFGHVLIVGGNRGMPGAIVLAARAALRTGAGKVTVVTHPENLQTVVNAVPEAMIKTCGDQAEAGEVFDDVFIAGVTHIAVGPGLGTDDWSVMLLKHCIAAGKPLLVDADGLNLIAAHHGEAGYRIETPLIITPHPGEAGRLLECQHGRVDIQHNRFESVRLLQRMFHTDTGVAPRIVILKGYGSLIDDGEKIRVCHAGNAAMASAGMGDVLSGITAALWAQADALALDAVEVAEIGVCLHACTADRVTGGGTRGLLASDITDHLHELLP
jgi:NAD(P)H-hydrate epimerase